MFSRTERTSVSVEKYQWSLLFQNIKIYQTTISSSRLYSLSTLNQMILWKLCASFCRCEEHCAIGQWGSGCANKCTCQNWNNGCDAVTGSCIDDDASSVEQTSPAYLQSSTIDRLPQTSGISNTEHTEIVSVPRETERQTEGKIIRRKLLDFRELRNCLPEDKEMDLHAFKYWRRLERRIQAKVAD